MNGAAELRLQTARPMAAAGDCKLGLNGRAQSSLPRRAPGRARWCRTVVACFSVWCMMNCASLVSAVNHRIDDREVDVMEVKNWALRFGKSIQQLSSEATCLRIIEDNFNNSGAEVAWVDGMQMLEEMRGDIQNMLTWKRQAVERIAEVAEHAAAGHQFEKNAKHDYINVKKLYNPREEPPDNEEDWKPMELEVYKNYEGTRVNTMTSAIHVPTNVYEEANEVINAIKWSEYMNPTFRNNIAVDPSSSWQFFGSSTGFLRLFPAMKWKTGEEPDMFDCRMRPWFIQAAASAKDIVILVDGSGSMTGLRKAIAREVVVNILDTLTDNDFVTVLRFSNDIEPVVPCFNNTLVQANERNIQEIKDKVDEFKPSNIANFTKGLTAAFELLQKFHRNKKGSQCNQAIMLITDGAPYTYEEVFRQYNWPNIPVRVFTYLIGREATDNREVNWMACANKGFYTHVANLAEVREQVQKYIPVMSRPIILSNAHPYIWTPVYADISTVQMTKWVWEARERDKLFSLILKDRENQKQRIEDDSMPDQDYESPVPTPNNNNNASEILNMPQSEAADYEATRKVPKKKVVNLMTTVATPVYIKRVGNNSMRVADLLGVAGTDVPIKEILKLTPTYKLGVNGYSFVITNNGYILYHPDLRPLFQDLLKPGYGNVDLDEVELVDNALPARDIDESLRLLRQTLIDRKIGWNTLAVKVHMDNMRRVVTRNNSYYYGPIDGTPFSMAIVLPEPYGHYQVVGQKEVKRKEEDWMRYFKGKNWRVHPEWFYCEIHEKDGEPRTPEDIIRGFLNEALTNQSFRWRTSSPRPVIFEKAVCERDLVQSLVFDAIATYVEEKSCDSQRIPEKFEDTMIKKYGITTTFVSTRSGLLRFHDHRSEEERANSTERPFHEMYTRATDELFYRRAVDFYRINSSAFVFSVPFDAGSRSNNSLVTGSHAIYLGQGNQRAPVAVVGLQFLHSSFSENFFNATSKCMQHCKYKCTDEELDCFLLDNNGFVVVSELHEHTGKFFGEIDYSLFNAMIEYGIYRRIHLFDYQAICLDMISQSGPASVLTGPLSALGGAVAWLWKKLSLLIVQYSLYSFWNTETAKASDYDGDYDQSFDEERVLLNKSKPRPCDKEFDLYEMQRRPTDEPVTGHLFMCHTSGCDKQFIVQQVPYTNLVMLVAYTVCPCEPTSVTLEPKEVENNETIRCVRMKNTDYRQRPENCTNYHGDEGEIQQCGSCLGLRASHLTLLACIVILALASQREKHPCLQ